MIHSRPPTLLAIRGSALIMALLIVALVALISTALMLRQQIDIYRTTQMISSEQAYMYALNMQQQAIAFLTHQYATEQKSHTPSTRWPQTLTPESIPGGKVSAIIWDAQGRYNINNLQDKTNQASFVQLLLTVNPDFSMDDAQALAMAVTDWLADTKNANPDLTDDYAHAESPYRAAHQLMLSASELRLIKGMNAQLYQQLEPNVIALPKNTLVNLNSTNATVLQSVLPSLDAATAEALIAQRDAQGPYSNMAQVTGNDLIRGKNINTNQLTLVSEFYLLQVTVQQNQQVLNFYSLLQTNMDNNKPNIDVLWQAQYL